MDNMSGVEQWLVNASDVAPVKWVSTFRAKFRLPDDEENNLKISSFVSSTATLSLIEIFNNAVEKYEVDQLFGVLSVATLSISTYLLETERSETSSAKDILGGYHKSENILLLWVEKSSLLSVIHAVFDSMSESMAELKKLALDLGYTILSNVIDFSDDSFGFKSPLREHDVLLLSLTAKYLESFMVTVPTHYPYMPAKHFATIHWPIAVEESCSGKVHSIFQFLSSPKSGAVNSSEISTSSSDGEESFDGAADHSLVEAKPPTRYCNYENVRRKQPWEGKFSTVQIMHLVREIVDTRNEGFNHENESLDDKKHVTSLLNFASEKDCDHLILMFKNVLARVRRVDPSLLYRSKATQPEFIEGSSCYFCNRHVATFMERLNPFHSIFSKGVVKAHSESASVATTDSYITSQTTSVANAPIMSSKSDLKHVNVTPAVVTKKSNGSQQKHHCRLCLRTICSSCCSNELYVGDKICKSCDQIVELLELKSLQEKKEKGSLLSRFRMQPDNTKLKVESDMNDITPAQVDQLADLVMSDHSSSILEDRSICCSVLMSDSLKHWRDDVDNDD